MSENQRLKELLDYLREHKYVRNQQDFVERIGSDKSTISQVMNGRISVPNGLFGGVVSAFPFVDEHWLRSGEGEMIKPSVQQTSYGNHSPNLNGTGNSVLDSASLDRAFDTIDKLLEEIASQRKLVEQSMAQTATLISILQTQFQKV